jgi:hypothetical protein
MKYNKTALVLGAGGFIGSHMVKRLRKEGYWVRGVDLKYPEFSNTQANEFIQGDLRDVDFVRRVIQYKGEQGNFFNEVPYRYILPFNEIYQFAADMGGAGFVFTGENDAEIMQNSVTINLPNTDGRNFFQRDCTWLTTVTMVFLCVLPVTTISSDQKEPGRVVERKLQQQYAERLRMREVPIQLRYGVMENKPVPSSTSTSVLKQQEG